jgi:hypothetical protein
MMLKSHTSGSHSKVAQCKTKFVKSIPFLLVRSGALAAMVLVLIGYAWWATALRPFTLPALAATLAAGMLFMILGSRSPVAGEVRRQATAAGAVVWAALALLLATWELVAFLQHPRADHPTLSYLANMVLDDHPVRALAFLMWLMVAMDLSRP